MYHCIVAHTSIVADHRWKPYLGMYGAVVLDIGILTDSYGFDIPADNTAIPDASPLFDLYITNDDGR